MSVYRTRRKKKSKQTESVAAAWKEVVADFYTRLESVAWRRRRKRGPIYFIFISLGDRYVMLTVRMCWQTTEIGNSKSMEDEASMQVTPE